MLQPPGFLPEHGGSRLVRGAQLLVLQARDPGIRGEGAQVHVHGDLRPADEVADVVHRLRPDALHRAQIPPMAPVVEPGAQVFTGVHAAGGEQIGDPTGRRDSSGTVEVHGDGQVLGGDPVPEAPHRDRVRPGLLKPDDPRPDRRLVLAARLEAGITDDGPHMAPAPGRRKRPAAQSDPHVPNEPLHGIEFRHAPMMTPGLLEGGRKREAVESVLGPIDQGDPLGREQALDRPP